MKESVQFREEIKKSLRKPQGNGYNTINLFINTILYYFRLYVSAVEGLYEERINMAYKLKKIINGLSFLS
jgi:hypothetical protein